MTIGIIGGGLTGVTLGYFLKENVQILEKNNELGGLCRSIHDEGFTFDFGGSHIIFSKDKQVLNFMIGCLGENICQRIRNTKILYDNRYVKYPFENGLSDLSVEDNFECLYYYIENLLEKKDMPYQNFKSWIYGTFGKGIAEKYMIPYNEKVWNLSTELMSSDWVANRVPQPPMEDVIKSSLGINTEGYQHQLYFYYPKLGGIQALIKSIEQGVKGEIRTQFQVKSIKKEDDKWIVSDNKQELIFDRIISTIHLSELERTLDNVPTEIRKCINDLKYNSLITVMIGVDQSKLNDISWLYIPQKDIKMNRISFPSNYSEFVAPSGKSSILAEITCNEGDSTWNLSDAEMANQVIEDLGKLKIINTDKVCYSKVMRSKYAYVVYDINHSFNNKTISRYFAEAGIELCGRFSEFKYLNMDACIRSAIDRSNRINTN
jgi:protoporphyrinogen oxidase